MKLFKPGDTVTVCNRRDQWMAMSIHQGVPDTFVVLDVRPATFCLACTCHAQLIAVEINGEPQSISAMWFDDSVKTGDFEHSRECEQSRAQYEAEYRG